MSALDRKFLWTEFKTVGAREKFEHNESLRELKARIEGAVKRGKTALPWFKGATFGDLARADTGSLKTNENLLRVTAIEADYDGKGSAKLIQPTEAAELLKKAGVHGLIYTTPSHAADDPRWRAILPLDHDWPPEDRYRFMARLNGIFFGTLDRACFNLSLSYYYGNIPGKPKARVILIEGKRWIDQADALDARAISPRALREAEMIDAPAEEKTDLDRE